MPQAIFDPQAARQAAAKLDRTAQDMMEQVLQVFAQFSDLGDHWRDRKYQRFAQALNAAVVEVRRYHDEVKRETEFLRRKAAIAEDYLSS